MPDSDPLFSRWLDRHLTGDEVARLSTRLARDPGLADQLAEMSALDQALTAMTPHAPPVGIRARRFRNLAVAAAAAAAVVAGIIGLWWRPATVPDPLAGDPPPPVSLVGSRPVPGDLPRPPRSADERAEAMLDRFLRRQPVARRTYTDTPLREIAEECLIRLQQKHAFQGTLDFRAVGSRAEAPLTFSKPAGSLRGLLLHASALAGGTLAVHPNAVSFVPLAGSPTKPLTQRLTAAPEAHESILNFCATGTLPPTWGLPASEFRATPQPDGSLEVTATEWRLAQLQQVIEAMDAPLLTIDVLVCALPSAEVLGSLGLQNFAELPTTEAPAAASMPSPTNPGFSSFVVGSVFSESQWEQLRPRLLADPGSLLAEFSLPALSGQWTDLGERAPDVLRRENRTLALHGVLGADDQTFDLRIGDRFLGADRDTQPRSSTNITLWLGYYLMLGYTDPAAAPGSPPRGLVLRVQPWD